MNRYSKCPVCVNGIAILMENIDETIDFKLDGVLVKLDIKNICHYECPNCGESFYDSEQCDIYDKAVESALYKYRYKK